MRILTGIQSTGKPHLGNILGAILPALQLAQQGHESLLFIADLHTLTALKDSKARKEHTYATAAAWLACGLDVEKTTFYRQSKIPAVCELAWYLSCFTPYPMLANAHAFKEKAHRLSDVNAGLFTYPVLMAADILLYGAELVPVGTDQLQHLEMTRDIAQRFNHHYGDLLVVPQAQVQASIPTVPGIDGKKMSKSYHNTLDVLAPEPVLKKAVMSIQTDSTPLDQPKDPSTCTIFCLYQMLASPAQASAMQANYLAGGYGYGQAKKELLAVLLARFQPMHKRFQAYMQNPDQLEALLASGEAKAQALAQATLHKVRKALGY